MSDYISREFVLNTIEDMDKALDTDRTVEEYKALLIECIKALPSRDSITELEKIKAEIEEHNRKYLSDDNAGLERAIWDFIEPRISELKGENNNE